MIDPVEEFLQVHIHHKPAAFGDILLSRLEPLMGVPPRSKTVARFGEVSFEDRREHLMQRLLDQSIRQRRDAERPHPALRLRYVHSAHRRGYIVSRQ